MSYFHVLLAVFAATGGVQAWKVINTTLKLHYGARMKYKNSPTILLGAFKRAISLFLCFYFIF